MVSKWCQDGVKVVSDMPGIRGKTTYIYICFWFGEMLYWVQEIIFFVIIVNGRSVIDGAAD